MAEYKADEFFHHKRTNADRIRQMSDEELAKMLSWLNNEKTAFGWLDWLKQEVDDMNDNVNHPAHYTAGGVECIDAIKAALTCQNDPYKAWLTGQIIKYIWRWPLKNGQEDLEKARFYLDKLIAEVEDAGSD